jgi:hypothetical protein
MITTTNTLAASVNFTQYRVVGDRAIYLGPVASDVVNDKLTVKSLSPKSGNGFLGNRRSDLALVRSTSVLNAVGDTVVRDRKIGVDFSIPVGTLDADLVEDAYQLGVLLQDSAFVLKLAKTGQIEI